jgi:hypothetical protein
LTRELGVDRCSFAQLAPMGTRRCKSGREGRPPPPDAAFENRVVGERLSGRQAPPAAVASSPALGDNALMLELGPAA